MQTVKFVTKENDKAICWCTTNDLVTFRDLCNTFLIIRIIHMIL